jgi:hypothetical protein
MALVSAPANQDTAVLEMERWNEDKDAADQPVALDAVNRTALFT